MSERETMMNLIASDRTSWEVFTDDPIMIAKFERIGAELIRVDKGGDGKFFKLRADQVVLRTGKRQVTEEQRQSAKENMRKLQESRKTPRAETPNKAS